MQHCNQRKWTVTLLRCTESTNKSGIWLWHHKISKLPNAPDRCWFFMSQLFPPVLRYGTKKLENMFCSTCQKRVLYPSLMDNQSLMSGPTRTQNCRLYSLNLSQESISSFIKWRIKRCGSKGSNPQLKSWQEQDSSKRQFIWTLHLTVTCLHSVTLTFNQ